MAVELALKAADGLSAKRTEKLAPQSSRSARKRFDSTSEASPSGPCPRPSARATFYARFCGVIDLEGIGGRIQKLVGTLLEAVRGEQARSPPGGLEQEELRLRKFSGPGGAFGCHDRPDGGTCLEANVHYPVDWILLKDCTRTLLKAVEPIRKLGASQPHADARTHQFN